LLLRKLQLLLICTACLLNGACTPGTLDAPIAVKLDREQDPARRVAALDQAHQQMPDEPDRIAALNRLVWSNAHPDALRIRAVDQLIEHNAATFRRSLSENIVRVGNWVVLNHIFDEAVKRQWTDATPAIVRHYAVKAYGIPDDQRPERKVIEKLNPGRTVEQVVLEVFANVEGKASMAQQAGAWYLLSRLYDRPRLLELLDAAPSASPLVIDLKAAVADLNVMPSNREGLLWLLYLRAVDSKADSYWQAATAAAGQLTGPARNGLALRHLAPLLAAGEVGRAATYDELLERLDRRIDVNAAHYKPEAKPEHRPQNDSLRFHAESGGLVWADLLTIGLLLDAVHEPGVTAALFEQADADLLDTASEHGGVLDIDRSSGGASAIGYRPSVRRHDLAFVPPDGMMCRLYTACAHYHFHAQKYRNGEHAGPGGGDLKTADKLNFNFLVFTFVDRNTLNVDYYQPGGVVVDLGVIRR